MLPFLSLLGIFLSVILLFFNARKFTSSIYLSLFFLFVSLYGFYQYILLYSKSVTLISLFLFNVSVITSPIYLIGPMLYWYVRSVLTDQAKLKKYDLWHFLPMAIYFISALPNAFVPWEDKVEAARTVVNDQGFIMIYKATLLSEFIPTVLIYLFRIVLVLGYTIWSAILFINYIKKKKTSRVLSKQRFMKNWLSILLGSLLVLVISQAVLIVKSFEMHFSELFFTFNILRVISLVALFSLLVSPFFFPTILYGLPRVPGQPKNYTSQKKIPCSVNNEEKHSALHLENNYINCIGAKIDTYMKTHEPYLEPHFNMNQLSVQTDIPAHHLGYYFREVKKESFTDYRNRWRIEHAKKLINEGKVSQMTLEAIAELSGFSNRNSFRTTFQRLEGTSPSNFPTGSKG